MEELYRWEQTRDPLVRRVWHHYASAHRAADDAYHRAECRERVLSAVAMKTVSIDKAAELLCVSRRTIYNHIGRGVLKTVRTLGGGSQRVTLESLVEWQASPQRRGERLPTQSS